MFKNSQPIFLPELDRCYQCSHFIKKNSKKNFFLLSIAYFVLPSIKQILYMNKVSVLFQACKKL